MNTLTNELRADENFTPSPEIGQLDVDTFQQSNLRTWITTDSQDMFPFIEKHNPHSVLQKQGLMTAILLTYQLNLLSAAAAEKFHVNYNMMVATETLNFPQIIYSENSPFINRFDSAKIWREAIASKNERKVIEAPIWLANRMKALQQRPPPTLKTVQAQWAASMEFSRKLDDRQPASLSGRENEKSS
jgi:hypothetical protein